MADQFAGHVTSIATSYRGGTLSADAALGATTIYVNDVADFAEEGGSLRIAKSDGTFLTAQTYTAIDDDASSITLAAGLASAVVNGGLVRVLDADGNDAVDTEATVVDDNDDSVVVVDVAHALIPLLTESVRAGINEAVLVARDTSGAWTVTDVLGKSAVAASSGGGSSQARVASATTSATIAAFGNATVSFSLALSFRLLSMTVDKAARVRLYATAAGAAADLGRPVTTDPADGLGCILDYVTTHSGTYLLSPLVDGSSMETTPSTSITGVIDNPDSSTQTITASFVYQPTE
jgi:hypothetical protein